MTPDAQPDHQDTGFALIDAAGNVIPCKGELLETPSGRVVQWREFPAAEVVSAHYHLADGQCREVTFERTTSVSEGDVLEGALDVE